MPSSSINFRKATKADAKDLAVLINYASEGFSYYVWEKMREENETAWEVGKRRAEREEGSFSYLNTTVAESDGKVIACLIGYLLPTTPEEINYSEMPPEFVPLQELENLCPGSWCIDVLATDPEYRNQGIGSELLKIAETLAHEAQTNTLCVIASDANMGARRLYERHGYMYKDQRTMVKQGWQNPGNEWLLLEKEMN